MRQRWSTFRSCGIGTCSRPDCLCPTAGCMGIGQGQWGPREPAVSLPYRVKISSVARFAAAILWTISLSAPSFGQARVETGAQSGQPHAPAAHHHHHRHMKPAAHIVCDTPDVHACHREFARRHGAQTH